MVLLKWLAFCILIGCWNVTAQKQVFAYHAPSYRGSNLKLNKVSLTQKGYIQFLRYVTEVPPISDFTFCLWMRSANLTYSHPLLSYSRHESDRYIRAWVSPRGEEIRLAIREKDIIKFPVNLKEHQWYHICQSWSSATGHWDLYLNGKLKHHGFNSEARGIVLPKGGDIVLGQEYTDFDKGLDDGIEGDIFGFNMVLSSTTPPNKKILNSSFNPFRRYSEDSGQHVLVKSPLLILRAPKADKHVIRFHQEETISRRRRDNYHFNPNSFVKFLPYRPEQYAFEQQKYVVGPTFAASKNFNSISNEFGTKTLGNKLVELSYNCALGMGAPLKGKEVLISWTKTPVRVFGGAILKPVDPFCN